MWGLQRRRSRRRQSGVFFDCFCTPSKRLICYQGLNVPSSTCAPKHSLQPILPKKLLPFQKERQPSTSSLTFSTTYINVRRRDPFPRNPPLRRPPTYQRVCPYSPKWMGRRPAGCDAPDGYHGGFDSLWVQRTRLACLSLQKENLEASLHFCIHNGLTNEATKLGNIFSWL